MGFARNNNILVVVHTSADRGYVRAILKRYGVRGTRYGVRGAGYEETGKELRFRRTKEIIRAIEDGWFPERAMMTVHPQRWTARSGPWVKELVWQNVKNLIKRVVVKYG